MASSVFEVTRDHGIFRVRFRLRPFYAKFDERLATRKAEKTLLHKLQMQNDTLLYKNDALEVQNDALLAKVASYERA